MNSYAVLDELSMDQLVSWNSSFYMAGQCLAWSTARSCAMVTSSGGCVVVSMHTALGAVCLLLLGLAPSLDQLG